MKVFWTPKAAQDLDSAVDYIALDKPDAAVHVANRIYEQVMNLAKMPEIGRVGAVPGTREIIFHPWPYIAVYRVEHEAVRILRIRHASQDWPRR